MRSPGLNPGTLPWEGHIAPAELTGHCFTIIPISATLGCCGPSLAVTRQAWWPFSDTTNVTERVVVVAHRSGPLAGVRGVAAPKGGEYIR